MAQASSSAVNSNSSNRTSLAMFTNISTVIAAAANVALGLLKRVFAVPFCQGLFQDVAFFGPSSVLFPLPDGCVWVFVGVCFPSADGQS